jgi:uncharacterized membrane-anchored protein YitT (DUF2179 family)
MKNDNAVQMLYSGAVILGGSITGLWSFTADRFTTSECIFIILGGMITGIGLGLICHALTTLLRR